MALLHEELPPHLVCRIFDLLEARDRARLALVCRAWQELSEGCCGRLCVAFSSLKQLYHLRAWLDRLAQRSALSVRECRLHWEGGRLLHPAVNSLCLEQFSALEVLHLKPPASAYWAMTPGVIASLAPLSRLRELVLAYYPSQTYVPGLVTLEEFAAFSRLQTLSIVVTTKQAPVAWTLALSPQLQRLRQLRDLSLAGHLRMAVNETAALLLGRLTRLAFDSRLGFSQPVAVPALQVLHCNCVGADALPFTGLSSLTELEANVRALDLAAVASLAGLRRLALGCVVDGVDARALGTLSSLTALEELAVLAYEPAAVENLASFRAFPRLRKLRVDLTSARRCALRPALGSLAHLQDLQLNGCTAFAPTILGGGLEACGALQRLRLEVAAADAPITSSSLRHLAVRCGRAPPGRPLLRLQALPCLRSLHLLRVPSLEECAPLVSQLAALSSLEELLITKEYGFPPPPLAAGLPQPTEAPGSFERLLHRLKALRGLKRLRIAAVNDDVSLSSTVLPAVQHLALASRGLAVCGTALPWPVACLQLAFRGISPHSLATLEAGAALCDWQPAGSSCGGRWLRAAWPWGSEREAPDFPPEVFEDAE